MKTKVLFFFSLFLLFSSCSSDDTEAWNDNQEEINWSTIKEQLPGIWHICAVNNGSGWSNDIPEAYQGTTFQFLLEDGIAKKYFAAGEGNDAAGVLIVNSPNKNHKLTEPFDIYNNVILTYDDDIAFSIINLSKRRMTINVNDHQLPWPIASTELGVATVRMEKQ